MAQATFRQRVVGNPGRKRKRNVGQILGFVLPAGNPGRKRGSMAKARKNRGRKAKSNPGHRKHHRRAAAHHTTHRRRRRTMNPGHRHHRRRRNPGMMGGIGPAITNAVFVIVGALGSKVAAQAVLGSNNVGLTGYAGNAAAGGILWFLTEKVMKNRAAANGVVAGTLVQIILRVINDYTPYGSYVSGLGMGDYQMQSFVTPQVLTNPWKNADVQIPNGWGAGAPRAALPVPVASAGPKQMNGSPAPAGAMTAAAGVSGFGGLYGGSSSLY